MRKNYTALVAGFITFTLIFNVPLSVQAEALSESSATSLTMTSPTTAPNNLVVQQQAVAAAIPADFLLQANVLSPAEAPCVTAMCGVTAGQIVSGIIFVNPNLTLNPSTRKVSYYLNGTLSGREYSAPFTWGGAAGFNTATLQDGTYTLGGAYTTSAGDQGFSITFTVNNSAPNDTTPPVISAVSSTNITSGGVTINWTTNEPSDSQVEYRVQGIVTWTATTNTSLLTNHSVALVGLSANTIYQYQVKSKDQAGNLATQAAISTFTTLNQIDSTPPVISAVAASGITTTNATITWTTNEASDSQVEYRIQGNATWLATGINASLVTNHSVTLSGLNPSTLYEFRVKSKDQAGNLATQATISSLTTAASTACTTAMCGVTAGQIVSGIIFVKPNLTLNPSTRKVSYYLNGTLSSREYSAPFTWGGVAGFNTATLQNGTYTLGGAYTTSAGDQGFSITFIVNNSAPTDATPPVISAIVSNNITATGATITWTTNEASDSQVEYRIQGNAAWLATGINASLVTNHSVALSGLNSSTLYEFRVKSKDQVGNLATQAIISNLTTLPPPDTTPPVILGTNMGNLSFDGVLIGWITDEVSDSQVQYRVQGQVNWQASAINAALVTNHTVALSGLTDGTVYEYQVKSRDQAGNLTIQSTIANFRTRSLSDTTPPVISAVTASGVTSAEATITWTTNEASTTQFGYRVQGTIPWLGTLNNSLVTNHSVTLTGLIEGTIYEYYVSSVDEAGNLATQATLSNFTTLIAPDAIPPVINGVMSTNLTSAGVTINWITNEVSDAQVQYRIKGAAAWINTNLNSTLLLNHSITLTGLNASTAYEYQVKSRDQFGNLAIQTDIAEFTTIAATDFLNQIDIRFFDQPLAFDSNTLRVFLYLGDIYKEVLNPATGFAHFEKMTKTASGIEWANADAPNDLYSQSAIISMNGGAISYSVENGFKIEANGSRGDISGKWDFKSLNVLNIIFKGNSNLGFSATLTTTKKVNITNIAAGDISMSGAIETMGGSFIVNAKNFTNTGVIDTHNRNALNGSDPGSGNVTIVSTDEIIIQGVIGTSKCCIFDVPNLNLNAGTNIYLYGNATAAIINGTAKDIFLARSSGTGTFTATNNITILPGFKGGALNLEATIINLLDSISDKRNLYIKGVVKIYQNTSLGSAVFEGSNYDVTLEGPIDGAFDLTINANKINVIGPIGNQTPLKNFTANAFTSLTLQSVKTELNQSYGINTYNNPDVQFNGNLESLGAGNIILMNSGIVTANDLSIKTRNGRIAFYQSGDDDAKGVLHTRDLSLDAGEDGEVQFIGTGCHYSEYCSYPVYVRNLTAKSKIFSAGLITAGGTIDIQALQIQAWPVTSHYEDDHGSVAIDGAYFKAGANITLKGNVLLIIPTDVYILHLRVEGKSHWGTLEAVNGYVQVDGALGVDESYGDLKETTGWNIISNPPLITDVTANNVTTSSATVNWKTNVNSDSQVEYRIQGNAAWLPTGINASLVTNHSVALSGLNPSTLYEFRVKSKDQAGNLAIQAIVSNLTTLTPPDTTAPLISYQAPTELTSTTATIHWSTNELSDSQVEFRVQGAAVWSTTALNPQFVTSYSITLNGLSAGTVYEYRARARDQAGNLAISSVAAFLTLPSTVCTTAMCGVTNNQIVSGIIFVKPNLTLNPSTRKVSYYLNGTLSGREYSAPFTWGGAAGFNTANLQNGTYTLGGAYTTSAGDQGFSITFTVQNNPPPPVGPYQPIGNWSSSITGEFTVSGNYIAGIDVDGNLRVLNASNPQNVPQVSVVDLPGRIYDVQEFFGNIYALARRATIDVNGNIINSLGGDLYKLNLTNPAQPTWTIVGGTNDAFGGPNGSLTLVNTSGFLFMLGGEFLKSCNSSDQCDFVTLYYDRSMLNFYDGVSHTNNLGSNEIVSSPIQEEHWVTNVGAPITSAAQIGQFLFYSDSSDHLNIFKTIPRQIVNPSEPLQELSLLRQFSIPVGVIQMVVYQNKLVMLTSSGDIHFYDLTDPTFPVFQYMRHVNNANQIAFSQGRLYVKTNNGGVILQ